MILNHFKQKTEQFFLSLQGDKTLWVIWVLLVSLSLLAVYSSIASLAYQKYDGDTDRFLLKQLWIAFSGFWLMYGVQRLSYSFFWKWSTLLFLLAILALLLTLLFGVSINQARRWLYIPFIGLSFQASDGAKIAALIILSRQLVQYANVQETLLFVQKILLPVFVIALLILPANFSTAFLLLVNTFLLSWMAGVRFWVLFKAGLGLSLIGIVSILTIIYILPHSFKRATTWKNRIENYWNTQKTEENYQIQEAKTAVWHGGLMGQGPGKGHMRYTLPHPYSDMIFAFIIEEYGAILGGLGLICLYIILFFRSLKIAQNSQTAFGRLLALGLGLSLVMQAFINMAVSVGLFPVTGQPLPFLSMGGTALWFHSMMLGILLSISKGIPSTSRKKY